MTDTYTVLRQFADSWAMLAIFAFFIASVIWAFRPGSTRIYEDTLQIPFRHEDGPAAEPATERSTPAEEAK